jgi:hypothetical protein
MPDLIHTILTSRFGEGDGNVGQITSTVTIAGNILYKDGLRRSDDSAQHTRVHDSEN